MSFLSGSPWQQPGIISGSNGYGQPSSGQQQQQQQHKPPNILSGANIPAALASSALSPSSLTTRHSDWHCHNQMPPGGTSAIQEASKITLIEDEVKLGQGRSDGMVSGVTPSLKIEDEGSGLRGDKHRTGGGIGSAGQSPSSPLSSYTSPSSAIPSPSISPGKNLVNSAMESKETSHPNFGQNHLHQNFNSSVSRVTSEKMDPRDGFYIQGFQMLSQDQGSLLPSKQASRGDSSTWSQGNKDGEKKCVTSCAPGGLLCTQKDILNTGLDGIQITKPYLGKQSENAYLTENATPDAERTAIKITTGLSDKLNIVCVGGGGMEKQTLIQTEKGRAGSCVPPDSRDRSQSVLGEDGRVGSCAALDRDSKTSQSSQQPQRTAVRRAMSDCSHLAVPMVMAGTYPTGMGGSPVMMPNVQNFTLLGTAFPPRGPYPHVAVRRSLTVTDGTEAAATAMTMMSTPLSPVLPSSPPPKRHHGTCETNLLLPVPPAAGISANRTQESTLNTTVPQFELKVELWSCALEEELALVNTPKKLAKKLRNSFGKSAGKKLCPLLDTPDPDTFLQYNPVPSGAKYSLLAFTTLSLPQAEGSFQSHSLIVLQDAEWSSWLPLYGNLCCRLVAQPACMTQNMMTGYLNQKQSLEGMNRSCSLYCVLGACSLSCYFTPEEIDAKVQPTLKVPINTDTRIRVMEKETAEQKSRSLSIINPSSEGTRTVSFTTDNREDLEDWLDALYQHLYDQSQWLHCCDQLMKIEVTSPRKRSLFLTKQADSVYNDLSINSPGKFESITDIIHNKIEETDGCFLIGHEEERGMPNWSSLFDGSHSVVVQKNVLPQSETSTPFSSPNPNSTSTPSSNKKRRAPPPPADREPYTPPSRPARPPLPPVLHRPPPYQEKENSDVCHTLPATRSKTGRPSLDAKFSAIIQQLQRNNASGVGALTRKNAPLGVLDVQPQGQFSASIQQLEYQNSSNPEATAEPCGLVRPVQGPGPVPAPRSKLRKSFRERISLKPL